MPKGHTNNPNGRPHGSKNKRTKEWDSLGESIMSKHTESFNEILEKLRKEDEEKFIDIYMKILEYFKPKLARTEIKTEGETELVIEYVNKPHVDENE